MPWHLEVSSGQGRAGPTRPNAQKTPKRPNAQTRGSRRNTFYAQGMLFDARATSVGEWTVLRVLGELDLASAPEFRSALKRCSQTARNLAVDLRSCDFVDSVGLGLILGASRRCSHGGGSFAVLVEQGSVSRLLNQCRVDELIPCVASLEVLALQ